MVPGQWQHSLNQAVLCWPGSNESVYHKGVVFIQLERGWCGSLKALAFVWVLKFQYYYLGHYVALSQNAHHLRSQDAVLIRTPFFWISNISAHGFPLWFHYRRISRRIEAGRELHCIFISP